ncbi:hypothetical protein AD428_05165, partial [Achromobacter sp. DMS1]|uniref:hypothetical protein n=1 Tax=Achromobacter sp. DMS1 TaxID=1688405 RepID=UPI0006C3C433
MTRATSEPGSGLSALAGFAAETGLRTLPEDVIRQAQACLLYGLSVGIASAHAPAPLAAASATDW